MWTKRYLLFLMVCHCWLWNRFFLLLLLFFTLCIEFIPPTVLCAINNSHKWVLSHWFISDDVIIVHFLFSVTLVPFSFMNAKTNPWSESKGFLCDAPTVRIPVVPSDGKVLLGNTWSSVNNPICFLMSHVTHPTLNELLARSLGVLSQTGIMAQKRGCLGLLSRGPSAFFFFPIMGLLRCIVIKASQVFQSGSVAKLVLILENKTNEKNVSIFF